jgi:hypothetical protein
VSNAYPEKALLLERLKEGGFNVPDFIFVSAERFAAMDFGDLELFLARYKESFKVIARSGHPMERYFKGGTFDSIQTYADIGGIIYARHHMITSARTQKRLSVLRQQRFSNAPEIELDQMGVIVMPFIEGASVMAKMLGDHWEFGCSWNTTLKVQREPFITQTPHDRRLLQVSQEIQSYLGFRCEIEYIISTDGEIHVVQAKDISNIEILEAEENLRSIRLDGVRRIRKRRNYRERPIFVMDNKTFYIQIIGMCEDLILGCSGVPPTVEDILGAVARGISEMEDFALTHQRFAVLGLSIEIPEDLYQVANHYLDDDPQMQKALSEALRRHGSMIDYFLSEADTLIARVKLRVNLCSHDAYGIDTVRTPIWSVFWRQDRHEQVIKEFRRLGFRTGDTIGIDIAADDVPTMFRV